MLSTEPTQDLTSASKDEIIATLPSRTSKIETSEAVLEFTGEAWINGQARDVDGKETVFSIPLEDLQQEDGWAIDETPSRHFVNDTLHTHENAPKWVQEWDGPFELQIKYWE